MDQYRVINELVDWMLANPWKPNRHVRCDHVTPDKETLGLYIGPKQKRKGWSAQIAQVDILVEDDEAKTVELLIEVQPDNRPKKILGDVLPALLADNYTPSGCDFKDERKIRAAVFLFVTVAPDKKGSQKRSQLEQLERTIVERLEFTRLDVRTVKFCIGSTEEDAVQKCKEQIQALLWNNHHPESKSGITI